MRLVLKIGVKIDRRKLRRLINRTRSLHGIMLKRGYKLDWMQSDLDELPDEVGFELRTRSCWIHPLTQQTHVHNMYIGKLPVKTWVSK